MNFSACIPYLISTISSPLPVRGVGSRYLSFSLFPINFVLLHLKVNSLFLLKSRSVGGYDGVNKKLPTKSDEEFCLVDKRVELSNLDLFRDMVNIMNLEIGITEK